MAKYEITTIKSGYGEIPQELQILETVQVDSIGATTPEQITTLLRTSKRQFILKSRNGWQYMTTQFVAGLAPSTNIYTDVSASLVREKTTPTFMSLEDLEALAAARKTAASPFRPRRKKITKSGKKVSKKSGKVRKNKKSKKSRN
jgi:hypothetical protein